MEFFRQEYRSGLPFPTPGDLPYPRIKPASLGLSALAGRFFTSEPPGKLCDMTIDTERVTKESNRIKMADTSFHSHSKCQEMILDRIPKPIAEA